VVGFCIGLCNPCLELFRSHGQWETVNIVLNKRPEKKKVSWVCSGWWVGTSYGEVQSSKKSLRSGSAVGPALLVNKIWNIFLQL